MWQRGQHAATALTMATFCSSSISGFETPFLQIWNYMIAKISHEKSLYWRNTRVLVIPALRQKFYSFRMPCAAGEGNQLLETSDTYSLNKARNSVEVPTQKTKESALDFLLQKMAKYWRKRPRKQCQKIRCKNLKYLNYRWSLQRLEDLPQKI